MTTSPLQFAKSFGALKASLTSGLTPDLCVLRLVDFWPRLAHNCGNPSYDSYFAEYKALLAAAVTSDSLSDCTPNELRCILAVVEALDLPESARAVTLALARVCAFVGKTNEAVSLCTRITGEEISIPEEDSDPAISELDRLLHAIDTLASAAPKTAQLLQEIATVWESELGHLWFDRVRCLFVGTNGSGSPRGRMRTLKGTVEPIGHRTSHNAEDGTDEVTFEGQLRTPDDPFVGAVYDSLKAVRTLFERPPLSALPSTIGRPPSRLAPGAVRRTEPFYHAHYEIENNKQVTTGHSIGLAAALVAYAQLIRPEIYRYERFISSEVAFTGRIAPDGALLPVNPDSISAKLERAYLSAVRYVVVPAANESHARSALTTLAERYPNRRLLLIVAERFSDVIENYNIVRAERVCIGQFVARKAARYSRMTKFQVPLLAVLIWVMLALAWPNWFDPWFDNSPVFVQRSQDDCGVDVFNQDSVLLWSHEFACAIDPVPRQHTFIGKLSTDSRAEVLLQIRSRERCGARDYMYWFDRSGTLVCTTYCGVFGHYPGDDGTPVYESSGVLVTDVGNERLVVSTTYHDFPARFHIRLWSSQADSLGWYVHAGALQYAGDTDFDRDGRSELCFIGTNNRLQRGCFSVLDPSNLNGVSRPYSFGDFVADEQDRAAEDLYVSFGVTDVGRLEISSASSFPTMDGLRWTSAGILEIPVVESDVPAIWPTVIYEFDSCLNLIDVKPSTAFLVRRDQLVAEHLLPARSWAEIRAKLMADTQIWRRLEEIHSVESIKLDL